MAGEHRRPVSDHGPPPAPPTPTPAPHPSLAPRFVSTKHSGDKVLVFERGSPAGPLLFVFNFHASASYTGYRIGAPAGGDWELALDSDDRRFSGHGRLRADTVCPASGEPWHDRPHSLLVYSPCRSAQVYRRRAAAPPSA